MSGSVSVEELSAGVELVDEELEAGLLAGVSAGSDGLIEEAIELDADPEGEAVSGCEEEGLLTGMEETGELAEELAVSVELLSEGLVVVFVALEELLPELLALEELVLGLFVLEELLLEVEELLTELFTEEELLLEFPVEGAEELTTDDATEAEVGFEDETEELTDEATLEEGEFGA